MKKLTVMLLIAAMVLGVSACGNSANKENTATESQMSTQEAEDLDAKINELTQKENSILENHKALWEKVFNSIDKSTVKDATATNYGDFLANSLDKIKDKFTDDELKSLKEDVEEIKKLEDELQPLLEKQSANASNKDSGKEGASVFPEFKAKDLDGNDVDSSIISKNAVTVLNFWFNGCSPCVQELPELNKLNEELKEKGVSFTDSAKKELQTMLNAVSEIVDLTSRAFLQDDLTLARQVEPLEQVIDKLKNELRTNHIARLQRGECSLAAGFVLSDLLTNLERVADHCSNIAGCLLDMKNERIDLHKYLGDVKSGSNEFLMQYNTFEEKYKLA